MVEQMESLLEQVEGQAILQAQAVRDYGVEHPQGVALKGERWGAGHMAMCPWKSLKTTGQSCPADRIDLHSPVAR